MDFLLQEKLTTKIDQEKLNHVVNFQTLIDYNNHHLDYNVQYQYQSLILVEISKLPSRG